jgi:multiple sugar transport system substrate-binding protein
MKKLRILVVIALAISMMMSLIACGSGTTTQNATTQAVTAPASSAPAESSNAPASTASGEKVKLKISLFSDGQNLSQTQKDVFALFTKEHPNIEPEFMYITSDTGNWNGYLTKIQTMIAGGQAPDVAGLGLEGVAMMVMNNIAMPIDDYIQAHQDELGPVTKNIPKALADIFVVDGKTYGIPYEANSVVTNINMDRFTEAGLEMPKADWTIDDLKAIAPKLSDPTNGKYAFGVPTNFFCLQALLYSNGGSPLNDDWSAGAINSPENIEVFEFLQDAIKKGWAPQPEPSINDVQLMTQGRIAIGWWGRWVTNDFVASGVKNIYVQNLPKMKSQKTCAGSAAFIVLNSTKYPEEAKTLATWTAKYDYVNTFMAKGSLPANTDYAAQICPALGVPQNWQAYTDVYAQNNWRRSQDPPEYAELGFVYSKYMNIIYANQMPVKEALDKAQEEIQQVFANSQYRKDPANLKLIDSLFKN